MREILFRGKFADNGKWVIGFYWFNIMRETHWITLNEMSAQGWNIEVIPSTVGQYTGLTDKNGTKIFEGDIISFNHFNHKYIAKIVFNERTCSFEAWHNEIVGAYGEKATIAKLLCHIEKVKVIGNIYDNPELLEDKQ